MEFGLSYGHKTLKLYTYIQFPFQPYMQTVKPSVYGCIQSENIFRPVDVGAVKFINRSNLAEALQYCMSRCRIFHLNDK